jgi:hypothetical protein
MSLLIILLNILLFYGILQSVFTSLHMLLLHALIKKENKIFLIFKEMQVESVAKSYTC